MKGYDSHLFVKKLDKLNKIKIIAETLEKYIKIKGEIKGLPVIFIDSNQFLALSLESLVKNLQPSDFKYTDKHFNENSHIFRKKGIYPYDYMDSWHKFNQTDLPKMEDFYDSLKEKNISEADYNYFLKTYGDLGCKNLGDYHDLYLYSDVTSLADVFEKFRDTCLNHYNSDPTFYTTAASLANDCMLLKSKVELKLTTHPDIYSLWASQIRGGLVNVAKRHVQANNK